MKRGMPSGGHHSPTAFIFLVNSHSKKSLFLLTMGLAGRIHNKMGHSAVHEYLQTLRRWYKVKRREAPPSQPTCSSGALWSVGCFGCALSFVIYYRSDTNVRKISDTTIFKCPLSKCMQYFRRYHIIKIGIILIFDYLFSSFFISVIILPFIIKSSLGIVKKRFFCV